MFQNITIGQYYNADSVIHRLDPRVKLVCTVFYLISLFLFQNLYGYLFSVLFLITVIKLSTVPFGYMLRGMKAILFLLILTVVFNLFLTKGTVLVSFGIFKITKEGLRFACFMAMRLTFLVIGASVMTLTTTPTALTDGMERLFSPLRKIGLPVHEIAMMMSIALRFIPILMDETDKIVKAQTARGADLDSGGFFQRAKAMVPILVPLFVSAFRRANDLATAMESRCYRGGDGRTKMKPLVYERRDLVAYLIMLLYFVGSIMIGRVLDLHIWIF